MPRTYNLKVEQTLHEGQTTDIIHVSGYLEPSAFPPLRRMLERVTAKNDPHLLLDFDGLEHISTTGLAFLMHITREIQNRGGDLKIVRMSEKIKRICDVLGFSSSMSIYDAVDEALENSSA